MSEIILQGQLIYGSNGEEDTLLGVLLPDYHVAIVADELQSLGHHESTVRYFISDVPLTKDELDYELAKVATGYADADYGMRYSELTGYLWTDEKLNVGGHDLITELKAYIGKYLYLEAEIGEYRVKPKGVKHGHLS